MPMTFKQYLLKNKNRTHHQVYGAGGWGGYYGGYNFPHNDQSIGDVTGGSFSIDGGEGEEDLLKGLPGDERPINVDELETDEVDMDNAEDAEPIDPDKQGIIRFIKGARLVYKRVTDEGTFEELWVYNTGKPTRSEFEIRKDILAGTDIPLDSTASEDGSQTYTMWTSGDVQMIKIEGLPN